MTSHFCIGAVLPPLPTHQSHTALYWLKVHGEVDVPILQAQDNKESI